MKGVTETVSVVVLMSAAISATGAYYTAQNTVMEGTQEQAQLLNEDFDFYIEECYIHEQPDLNNPNENIEATAIVRNSEIEKEVNLTNMNLYVNGAPREKQFEAESAMPQTTSQLRFNKTAPEVIEQSEIRLVSGSGSDNEFCDLRLNLDSDYQYYPDVVVEGTKVEFEQDLDSNKDLVNSFKWSGLETSLDETSGPVIENKFQNPGSYNVELQVEDIMGQKYTETKEIAVLEEAYFILEIEESDTHIEAGEEFQVEYEVENTGDIEDTQEVSFEVQEQKNYNEHTLEGSEVKSDTLTWETEEGDQGHYTYTVLTEDSSFTEDLTVQDPDELEADFSYSPGNPRKDEQIGFIDESSPLEDQEIESWEWEFGDGESSTEENPAHSFEGYDDYIVQLQVDDGENIDETTETVSVADLEAEFEGPEQVEQGEKAEFTEESTTENTQVSGVYWDFDNGGTSTEEDPEYVYDEAGEYEIRLEITGQNNRADSKEREITVKPEEELETSIQSPESDKWYKNDFTVSVSDTDDVGNPECTYRINEEGYEDRNCNSEESFTVTVGEFGECNSAGQNQCKVESHIESEIGDWEESNTANRDFNIDYEPPVTSIGLNHGEDSDDLEIEAEYYTASDHSPVMECGIDWQNNGLIDTTIQIDNDVSAGALEHTFDSEGEYTARMKCTDKAGNQGQDYESISVPDDEDLEYEFIEDHSPTEIVDQDAFEAEVDVETNAQELYWKMDGREHQLSEVGENSYNTIIDVEDLLGEYEAQLVLKRNDQSDTEELDDRKIKRTPEAPIQNINIKEDYSGVDLEIETDYNKPTRIVMGLEIENDGEARYEDTRTIESCDSECTESFAEDIQEGDKITAITYQEYEDLTSETRESSKTATDVPSLEFVAHDSPTDNELATTGSWRSLPIGVAKEGFEFEEVQEARFIDSGRSNVGDIEINELVYDAADHGIWDDMEEELEDHGEPLIAFNGSFEADEVSEGEDITLELELGTGETVETEIFNVEKVEDVPNPEISRFDFSGVPDEEGYEVSFSAQDSYHMGLDYTISIDGNEEASGHTGQSFGSGHSDSVIIEVEDEPFPEIGAMVQNDAGDSVNSNDIFMADVDNALKSYETHGDPQNKINNVVHGDEMTVSRLEDEVMPDMLETTFEEDDLQYHNQYREYFNWYIINTEKDICGHMPDSRDCPLLDDNLDVIESSDTLQGGRTARHVVSDTDFRARAYRGSSRQYTSIPGAAGSDAAGTFAHEVGHSHFGWDDEYGGGNTLRQVRETHIFPETVDGQDMETDKYPNTWGSFDECADDVNEKFEGLSESHCDSIDADEETIWRIRAGDGASLMEASSEPYVYYQNHEMRISHLIEDHPIYE